MKNFTLLLTTFLLLLFYASTTTAQTIYLQLDPLDVGMTEANRTNDCQIQNNGYSNQCNSSDGDDPENTDCDDCIGGGAVDVDITTIWECGGNFSTNHFTDDRQGCGYTTFNSPSSGGTTYSWTVSKTETIQVRTSGSEDDIIFCGGNDGVCSRSPYTNSWNNLNDARATYNSSLGSWAISSGLDIDASRCPYSWTGTNYSAIENCSSGNSTNDYITRWRYRYHFGNSAGTLSGMDAPNINGSDFSTCGGSYDRGTLTASSFTNCYASRMWQYSFNDGAWQNVASNTNTYNPPNRTEGKHEYRFRVGYYNNFSGSQAYTYSNTRTDRVGDSPTLGTVSVNTNCWQIDGSNTYTITARATDDGGGVNQLRVLINYQDGNGLPNSGYLAWGATSYVWSGGDRGDPVAASGGGFSCKYNGTGGGGYGKEKLTLVSSSTTFSGGVRTVNFVVRPVVGQWTENLNNDISIWAQAANGNTCNIGWVNNNLNFDTYDSPLATASVSATEVCNGDNVTYTLTNPAPGTFVRWQYRWNNTGSWNNWYSTNPAVWPSGNCGNTLYVRAQSTYGSCTEYSNVVTTQVDCAPAGNTVVNDASFCVGGNTVMTSTATVGVVTHHAYDWDCDNPGSDNNTWTTNNPHTWGTSGNAGRTICFRARIVNGTCIGYSAEQTVTIYNDPIAPTLNTSNIPNGTSICPGQTLSATFNVSTNFNGTGTCNNQYQYSINGGAAWASYTPGSSINTNSATGSVIIQTRRVCDGSGCNGAGETYSTVISWPVVPDPTNPAITGNTTICTGGSATITRTSTGSNGISCITQWQRKPVGSGSWTDFGTVNSASVGTGVLTQSYEYRLLRECSGNGCGVGTSNTVTVTVVPDPSDPVISGTTNICEGGSATIIRTSAGNNGTGCNTQWQRKPSSGITWSDFGTLNSASVATGTLTESYDYRLLRECSGSGCGVGTSNIITVTVVPDPSDPVISGATTICTGGSATITRTSSGSNGVSCNTQWQRKPSSGSTWNDFGTLNSASVTTGTLTESYDYRLLRECSGSGCGVGTSNIITVTVVADPSSPVISGAITICEGGTTTLTRTNAGSNGAGCNTQWQRKPSSGSTWSDFGTLNSASVNTVALTQSFDYRLLRECSGSGCGVGTSNIITVIVVPDPSDPVITGATTICSGGNATITRTSSGSNGVSCNTQWQRKPVGSGTWTDFGTLNSASVGTGTLTQSYEYRLLRECSGSGCGVGTSNTITVIVVADPGLPTVNVATPTLGTSICLGGVVSATFTSGTGGVSCTDEYRSSVDGGSSWSTYTPGNNITSTNIGVNQVVIQGRRNCSGNGCDGVGETYTTLAQWTVTGDPIAPTLNTATPSAATSVCIGGLVSATFNAGSGGVSCADEYQVSVDGGSTWTSYTAGSNIAATTIGTNTIIVQGRRNCSGEGCDGAGTTFATLAQWSVVLDPSSPTLNVATPASGSSVCIGGIVSATLNSGTGGSGCTDEYRYSTDGGSTWTTYTAGSNITANNIGVNEIIIEGRRVCTGSGCNGTNYLTLAQWSVVEDPVAPTLNTATPVSGSDVCEGATILVTLDPGSGGLTCADQYLYTYSGGGGGGGVVSGGTISIATVGKAGQTIDLQTRRFCAGNGCDGSAETYTSVANWTVVVDPVAPTLNVATPTVVTEVCVGGTVSATFNAGTSGTGLCTDEYQYSVDGGSNWAAYTPGNNITATTSGVNTIVIQGRRDCSGLGCDGVGETFTTLAEWSVAVDPIAPTLNVATPSTATVICNGGVVSAIFNSGSGGTGVCTDEFRYSLDGGTSWSAYTPGSNITATSSGVNQVVIQGRRACTGNGCTTASYVTLAEWTVVDDPIAPTLNTATPSTATVVCNGGVVSATFNAGSGGTGVCTDEYQYSLDGGTSWAAYTPGSNITATNVGVNQIIVQGRRDCSGNGCNASSYATLAQWTVVEDPIAPTLDVASPSLATPVCNGGVVSATFNSGTGGTGLCTDEYQYSVDGGVNWNIYTPGNNITATNVGTNTIIIQGRRDCDGNGCDGAGESFATLAQWSVVLDPSAPTLNTATPASATSICIGADVSATFNAGTGGTGVCSEEYQYSVDGGSTWSAYTPGSNITSTSVGVNQVIIQGRRVCSGSGCDASSYATLAQWTVVADPVAPTLNVATPSVATSICDGGIVSATFTAGSGGVGTCADEYRYSLDGGTSWAVYTSGTNITATNVGVNQVVIQGRRVCSGSGCNAATYVTLAEWTVVADPVAPTVNTATPSSGGNVCEGTDILVTFNAGSDGLSCVDEYFYSYSGGGNATGVIPGGTLSIPTANKVGETITLQTRRNCTGNGCDGAAETFSTVASWTVINNSTGPTSLVSNPIEVCAGGAVNLTSPDGSLGAGAMWYLYDTDPTVGSPVAIQSNSGAFPGFSVTNITSTTTYYVRAEGTCGNSSVASTTVNVILAPVAGTITKVPDQNSICQGQPSVSAVFGPGSEGGTTFVDINEYKIGTSGTWITYSGPINTSALSVGTVIFVRTYRTTLGNNCSPNPSSAVEASWVVDGPNNAISVFANNNPVCPSEAVQLTFAGDVGSGSQLEWYTGAGGTGTFVGTTNPITINPTLDNTYYAYVSGGACPTAEESVAIDVRTLAEHLTLPNLADLQAGNLNNLIEECTVDGWTYYSDPLDSDKWLFAIEKNGNVATFDVDLDATTDVMASVFPGIVTPHGSYLMRRYWNLNTNDDISANGGINIRFYYDPADLADVVIKRDQDFIIYSGQSKGPLQWFKTNAATLPGGGTGFLPSLIGPNDGNEWDFEADNLAFFDGTQNGVTYVQFDGLTSLSGGTGGTTFGENNPLLPVELVSFMASPREVDIKLEWITASELNNDKFEVLRSDDAIIFEKIGEVDGNGTTFEVSNYSFIDEDVQSGILYYYKLRQLDFDGTADESDIVSAIINIENKLVIGELVPNPAYNQSAIEIISPTSVEFKILITNMMGQEIDFLDYDVMPGSQSIIIDVDRMAPGNYLISLQSSDGMVAIRKLKVIK